MNKDLLIITGVLVGSFLVANHLMKSKAPKMAETMSNADGGRKGRNDKGTGVCRCKGGVIGYCGSQDCKTCCDNYSSASGCGCGGSSNFGGCCGA